MTLQIPWWIGPFWLLVLPLLIIVGWRRVPINARVARYGYEWMEARELLLVAACWAAAVTWLLVRGLS